MPDSTDEWLGSCKGCGHHGRDHDQRAWRIGRYRCKVSDCPCPTFKMEE